MPPRTVTSVSEGTEPHVCRHRKCVWAPTQAPAQQQGDTTPRALLAATASHQGTERCSFNSERFHPSPELKLLSSRHDGPRRLRVGTRGDRSGHRSGPGPKRTRVWVSTKISPVFPKTQRSLTPRIVDLKYPDFNHQPHHGPVGDVPQGRTPRGRLVFARACAVLLRESFLPKTQKKGR